MSSSSHAQLEQRGKLSNESKPQVVVRAGKYFVCSACGTMVEVPADVVGQLVIAVDPAAQEEEVDTSPPQNQSRTEKPTPNKPVPTSTPSPSTARQTSQPPRPKQPRHHSHQGFTSKIIDGLAVPSAGQLDRAMAWVSFHLKVLDRQGSEIKRLKKLLKQHPTSRVPCPSPRGHAHAETKQERAGCMRHEIQKDVSMAPTTDHVKERGPP
ncbi:hypothetical protein Pan97_07810 [Bremerella volcania]|uniref:Uncharacterized protein n=1 Tax=Bremerella volcania TaxID=2527984 RepID=A0A518C3H9_9BACT|nr:hypothetical protein [Bremerella volcania]QDU73781.1 hypothetical protein Pan97_07810 [Bremerella volcania]